jgi:hypothetical protein
MRMHQRTAGLLVAIMATTAFAGSAAPAVGAEEPSNVAAAARDNAPTLEVGYVTGWNSAAALNNGRTAATDDYTQMWGTWGDPAEPAQDWASYTWEKPVTVSSSRLYLWQNHLTGDSGVMIPSAWQIEYRSGAGEWMPVTGASLAYELPVLDEAAPVSSLPAVQADFDAVTTTAVRLVLDRAVVDGEKKATSVIEWEVIGVDAPNIDPEPTDPGAFIDAEAVAVRTLTGTAPELPAELWVIGENGPLAYENVEWAAVAPAAYAEEGSFEVAGVVDGFPEQPVSATVFVADELSSTIDGIDYAATITTPGTAPVLPRTVRAHYDDGTTSSDVAVAWDEIEPSAYASADSFFDVAGAVDGYSAGAVASVFVVEPASQAGPLVAIDLDSAPQGSGWYTSAPTVAVTAEAAGAAISTIEYSLDGQTWSPYTSPFPVDAQGEVTVRARAMDGDGAVGEASESVRIDTVAPTTAIDVATVDAASALVTLTPSDAEPGSGVTRTIWSDGPDPSPTGETNNMYATYEAPFSVQLTQEPRYVHVQTQDAAGNVEAYATVLLPAAGAAPLDLRASTTSRCVAGKVQLVVSGRNADAVAAEATITTSCGAKSVDLAPGKTRSLPFAVRAAELAAGEVQVTGAAGDRAYSASAPYLARSCG